MASISPGTVIAIIDALMEATDQGTLADSARRMDELRVNRSTKQRVKKRRGATPAQKRYGRMFKKLAPKYKKKNGSWKKDGFKRCVRAAHRECRRK